MRPFNANLTLVRSPEEAVRRLQAMGVDPDGIRQMAPKMQLYCLELPDVPAETALAIKRDFLAAGAEAAISGEAYHHHRGRTAVILIATLDQFRRLLPGIEPRSAAIDRLAAGLPDLFTALEAGAFVVPTPRGELRLDGRPLLMGILNCTPDSFYDGGRFFDGQAAIARGRQMIGQGADLVDVGGESTRPGAEPVTEAEEMRRVLPVVAALAPHALVSVDTQKPAVARRAMAAGAAVINDVGALRAPGMVEVAAETGAAVVLMHMLGEPRTMQREPRYDNLYAEVIAFLAERIDCARRAGVAAERMVVDPGIGFGKTVAHNLELLRDLPRLRTLGRPILVGPSHKSFIGKTLGVGIGERGPGTAAAVYAAVMAGAHILRVHDPAAMKPFVEMAWALKLGENWSSP
jgi:dihydropteroate synthase